MPFLESNSRFHGFPAHAVNHPHSDQSGNLNRLAPGKFLNHPFGAGRQANVQLPSVGLFPILKQHPVKILPIRIGLHDALLEEFRTVVPVEEVS